MAEKKLELSGKSQDSLLQFMRYAQDENRRRRDLYNKMCAIDIAYARYVDSCQADTGEGIDRRRELGEFPCGSIRDPQSPIVISQVDSFVGYLADVYCSGYPMFPVATKPKQRKEGEQLQAIIDQHAILGGYQRQLVKNFKAAMKYNVSALEIDWCPVDRYSVVDETMKPLEKGKVKGVVNMYNSLKDRDMYNVIMDPKVTDPADIPMYGEYAGYVELFNRTRMIKWLQYLATTDHGYNTTQALGTGMGSVLSTSTIGTGSLYYQVKPQISELISGRGYEDLQGVDWSHWFGSVANKKGLTMRGLYEVATIYARIIPSEHLITAPNANVPQIWKLQCVNNAKLICAKRIISPYDLLPMLFGQPFEDHFGLQTQSLAENQMGYQDTVSKLVAIRMNSARRAVTDRAIYDPNAFDQDAINSPHPAAKIPMKPNALRAGKTIDTIFKNIPFDSRGTETVIQDAELVTRMSGQASGLNRPQQGEFQKGNKSVTEWNDTMSGSDNRLRLVPMVLEYQVFAPLKEMIKMNIHQYGVAGTYPNMKDGGQVEITNADLDKIRTTALHFKIADGYIPISKMASVSAIKEGFMMINQSPALQAALGPTLPGIWAHLMSLQGVQGLDEYMPTQEQAGANIQQAQAEEAAASADTQQGAPQ